MSSSNEDEANNVWNYLIMPIIKGNLNRNNEQWDVDFGYVSTHLQP